MSSKMILPLLEGIKIVDYCSDTLKSRALINSGTCLPVKLNSPEILYSEDAFIPVESWRELDYKEQSLLFSRSSDHILDRSTHVGVISLPEAAMAPLIELGVAFAQTVEDCQVLAKRSAYQGAVDHLTEYLRPLCRTDENLAIHKVSVNAAGLSTVTYHPATRKFIGLHLDSWDKLPVEQRHLSTNRICINLGLEDRFLLLINLTLSDIMQLSQASSAFSQGSPIAVRDRFLTQYPNYPVVKLRISPGEAYIAPTENMIHDGCTVKKQFSDVTLTIRGHIGLPTIHFSTEETIDARKISQLVYA